MNTVSFVSACNKLIEEVNEFEMKHSSYDGKTFLEVKTDLTSKAVNLVSACSNPTLPCIGRLVRTCNKVDIYVTAPEADRFWKK